MESQDSERQGVGTHTNKDVTPIWLPMSCANQTGGEKVWLEGESQDSDRQGVGTHTKKDGTPL